MSDKKKYIMKFLDMWEIPIFESIYGLNGKEKLSRKNIIKEYNLSNKEFEELLEKIQMIKDSEVDSSVVSLKQVDKETQKLIDRMSEAFFSMFNGIDPIVVEKSLKNLKKVTRHMIFLYYGLDGVNCLDYNEIADRYNVGVDEVIEIIEKGVTDTKKHFGIIKVSKCNKLKRNNEIIDLKKKEKNKYYKLVSKYGESEVEKVFDSLKDRDKKIISLCYRNDNNYSVEKVAEMVGVNPATVYFIIKKVINQIESFIENPVLYQEYINKKKNDFQRLEDKYGAKMVNEVFDMLDEKDRHIASLRYKDNYKFNEISKMLNLSTSTIQYVCDRVIKNIGTLIENRKLLNNYKYKKESGIKVVYKSSFKDRANRLVDLKIKYGEDIVNKAFSLLKDKEKMILDLYYNGDENNSIKDISKMMSIPFTTVDYNVRKGIEKIEILINKILLDEKKEYILEKERKDQKLLERRKEFCSIVKNKDDYNRLKQVLSEEDFNIIGLYYGLNIIKIKDIDELSREFNLSEQEIENKIKSIKTIIDNFNKFKRK